MRIVFFVTGAGLFAFLCYRLGLGELGTAFSRADPLRIALFLSLSTAVFVTYAARWSLVLEAMGSGQPALSIATLVRFRAAEHAVSTLLPSAHLSGEPVRALLLRRRRLDWAPAVASVAVDRMLDTTATSVLGPLYVAVFFLANDRSAWAAPWVTGGMLAGVGALALFYVRAYRGGTLGTLLARRSSFASVRGPLEAVDRQLTAFLHTRSFFVALGLSFAAEGLMVAELWTLAQAFALPISLPTLLGVMVGMGIAQLVPIPAALGSLEATEVGVLTLAGSSAPLGLAVGLIVRAREALWIFVGLAGLYAEGLSWRWIGSAPTSGNARAIETNE